MSAFPDCGNCTHFRPTVGRWGLCAQGHHENLPLKHTYESYGRLCDDFWWWTPPPKPQKPCKRLLKL